MRSSVRSRLAPPIGEQKTEIGGRIVARGGVFSGSRGCPIHRVSPCASRRAFTENDVSGAVYPSSVFRSLLSVIVKRKHIRSNRMVEKLERQAVRLDLRWIGEDICSLSSVLRHLTRASQSWASLDSKAPGCV